MLFRSMMKASIPMLMPESPPIGKMDLEAWSTLQQSLLDLEFLKKEQDLTTIFTNEFVE